MMDGWKTFATCALLIVGGLLLLMFGPEDRADLGITMVTTGIGFAGLRHVTSGPPAYK